MKVRLRYFAAARELSGCDEEIAALEPEGMLARSLLERAAQRHPRLGPFLSRMRVAINGEFATLDASLHDGDEIDVLPPVAGGSIERVAAATIERHPLSIDELFVRVAHPSCGGVCMFIGTVRESVEGRNVRRLDYEAHDALALRELERILGRIVDDHPQVRIAASHRVGQLAVGDLAVIVAAAAPHRTEAFLAARAAIEQIKATVPVWKKEWFEDGEAHWVNLQA